MRNFSLSLKTNSAYARLPLNGRPSAEVIELQALHRQLQQQGIDLRPRLRKRPEVPSVPASPEALQAQTLEPERVAAWLRA